MPQTESEVKCNINILAMSLIRWIVGARIGHAHDDVRQTWPPLPSAPGPTRCATLHLWTQIVGKIRLALAPPVNHWWHVTLAVTARGLTTSPMPCHGGMLEMTFDFVDHQLVIDASDGRRRIVALRPEDGGRFLSRGAWRRSRTLAWTSASGRCRSRFPAARRASTTIATTIALRRRVGSTAGGGRCSQVDGVLKEFRGRFLGK